MVLTVEELHHCLPLIHVILEVFIMPRGPPPLDSSVSWICSLGLLRGLGDSAYSLASPARGVVAKPHAVIAIRPPATQHVAVYMRKFLDTPAFAYYHVLVVEVLLVGRLDPVCKDTGAAAATRL